MSLLEILNISRQALRANRYAIDLTSKNIANANNENYTRREARISDFYLGAAGLKTALEFGDFQRIRNSVLEHRLHEQAQEYERANAQETLLTQVQNIFDESGGGGLGTALNEFWSAWNELALAPENSLNRTLLKDKAVNLIRTFKRIYTDLDELRQQNQAQIEEKVRKINRLLDKIKDLNQRLVSSSDPDLLDQRDALVRELSHDINIQVKEGTNNKITISSNGAVLLSEGFINYLSVEQDTSGDYIKVRMRLTTSGQIINIQGGELGGLVNFDQQVIPSLKLKLDTMARGLAVQINRVHRQGYNLAGETGINFFADNVQGVSSLELNSEILGDPDKIAASDAAGETGNNSIALELYNLKDLKLIDGMSFSDYYTNLQSALGNEIQTAQQAKRNGEIALTALQNQRDMISGVSLDEEMAKLIQFQQNYQASAKLISTVDTLMQITVNMV